MKHIGRNLKFISNKKLLCNLAAIWALHQQTLIFGYVTLCDTTAAMALCANGTLLQVTTDKFKYKIK